MAGISRVDDDEKAEDLTVREPLQRRTREQWQRVLDAGVHLLEEGGYEAFTIAALCEKAEVPPRALYARAATKDALFLAVYDHGMSRVRTGHEVFAGMDERHLEDENLVEQAVRYLVTIFVRNAAFLRAVVLISGAHPEVRRRGEAYSKELGELFTSALSPLGDTFHSDSVRQRGFCFSLVFSALVVRTAYGSGFGIADDDEVLTRELSAMAQRYLIGQPATPL